MPLLLQSHRNPMASCAPSIPFFPFFPSFFILIFLTHAPSVYFKLKVSNFVWVQFLEIV
ncbi:uncharacterized protein DS421_19g656820 [Arachis hypogaea]|uniref:Uncharacterized protein n=1 Tax=Arachis hypogaea TaxID=3818 RepID=A0A6B9V8Z3_ARAHY|nr:uncharacterized protein DS421_19g656820 [Arachis hypogaea]